MQWIEVVARRTKRLLELSDNSSVVCIIRPIYNRVLTVLYSRRGVARIIGGDEEIRLRPQDRLVPEDYEPTVVAFLRDVIHPSEVILDVGANLGVLTVLMARWVANSGHIHAFEPNPICCEALARNLALNGLSERVTVNRCALSEKVGTSAFFVAGTSGRSSFSSKCMELDATEIEVPVRTIDEYCRVENIKPSLIKIDVEGYEFSVLEGARQTLRDCRPVVVVEFHPMNWPTLGIDLGGAAKQIQELGYAVEPLEGQRAVFSDYGHVVLKPLEVHHLESAGTVEPCSSL